MVCSMTEGKDLRVQNGISSSGGSLCEPKEWIYLGELKRVWSVGTTNSGNKEQTLTHTYMAIVRLCQFWHNDLCVSFSSHGARVQESSLI